MLASTLDACGLALRRLLFLWFSECRRVTAYRSNYADKKLANLVDEKWILLT
jgi:hypothetical protein